MRDRAIPIIDLHVIVILIVIVIVRVMVMVTKNGLSS